MSVQAKFYVSEVTRFGYGGAENAQMGRKVKLQATSRKDESSLKFWQATPSGQIELSLSADRGAGAGLWFEERIGKCVILTFEDAPDENKETGRAPLVSCSYCEDDLKYSQVDLQMHIKAKHPIARTLPRGA